MGLVKRTESSVHFEPSNISNQILGSPLGTAELLEILDSGSVEERRHAANSLVGRNEAVGAMVGQLMRENNMSVRAAVFASLIKMPDPETARLLVRLLQSEDANLRNEAIEVLSTMPDEVEPLMESLLCDEDPDVRIFAVNIVASIQHESAVDWLVSLLERDTETNVCAMALDLLTEIGDERCLPVLDLMWERYADEPYLAFVIDLARSRISSQESHSEGAV